MRKIPRAVKIALDMLLSAGRDYLTVIGGMFCLMITSRHWNPEIMDLTLAEVWGATWQFGLAVALLGPPARALLFPRRPPPNLPIARAR